MARTGNGSFGSTFWPMPALASNGVMTPVI